MSDYSDTPFEQAVALEGAKYPMIGPYPKTKKGRERALARARRQSKASTGIAGRRLTTTCTWALT